MVAFSPVNVAHFQRESVNINPNMIILHCNFPGGMHFKLKLTWKGKESYLIAEYVLEIDLLLGTDGLKIKMCTYSQGVLNDIPFTF